MNPDDYDWDPAQTIDVGEDILLDVDGPIRVDLRTSAFGADSRHYRVQWYPRNADGSTGTIVTTPDGAGGTHHGGHVTLLGPATEYIAPPFQSQHGYRVRIAVPPDGGKSHGAAASYLHIYRGQRREK